MLSVMCLSTSESAEVVTVRVRDHGARHRAPWIDIEITWYAVQALLADDDHVSHGHPYAGVRKSTMTRADNLDATDRAIDRGVAPLKSYTTGFILAQQARADETLDLARRGGSQDYGQSFAGNVSRLADMFEGDPEVTEAVLHGLAAHRAEVGRPLCPCRFYPDKAEEVRHRT